MRRSKDVLGLAIVLLFVGAVLRYAITVQIPGISIQALGSILMVAGVIVLAIGLVLLLVSRFDRGRRGEVVGERQPPERGPL